MSSAPSRSRSRSRSKPVKQQMLAPTSVYIPTVTPISTLCCGIALTTCIATIIATVFYGLALILILAVDCRFTNQVIYFFSFVCLALISTVAMAGLNVAFPRYHFNCTALSASLFYSGTAALVLFGLIYTSVEGLCPKPNERPTVLTTTTAGTTPMTPSSSVTPIVSTTETISNYLYSYGDHGTSRRVGIWSAKYMPNYFIWVFSAMGWCFQVVAHYYYG